MKLEGGCHCGAVRFSIEAKPPIELLDCNCSICAKTGYLHLNVPHDQFTLLGGADHLTAYRFGSTVAEHLFCKTCGIKSFYQPRSHASCWSVNFRCLDTGHALVPAVRQFDGQNWENALNSLAEKR